MFTGLVYGTGVGEDAPLSDAEPFRGLLPTPFVVADGVVEDGGGLGVVDDTGGVVEEVVGVVVVPPPVAGSCELVEGGRACWDVV
jgi:hypothetical protein